jgi:hypothetical protein
LFSSFKHTSATGVCRWVRRFGSQARHGNTARERVFVTTEAMEWSGHVGKGGLQLYYITHKAALSFFSLFLFLALPPSIAPGIFSSFLVFLDGV